MSTKPDQDLRDIPVQNIDELVECQELIYRAKSRKHQFLRSDEFIQLRDKFRRANQSSAETPDSLMGRWSYTVMVNKVADEALEEYLSDQGISVIPVEKPDRIDCYETSRGTGLARVALVERKIRLGNKICRQHQKTTK